MGWRLAKSLETLRGQVNAAHPSRSKKSDGTIGDAAHASGPSDHNPNAQGVVCALDLTHDPANGFDAHALAEVQRLNPHPDLKYIVSQARIASRKHGWVWRASSGHFNHVHFSVGVGPDGQSKQPYDDTMKWDIGSGSQPAPVPPFKEYPVKLTYFRQRITLGPDGRGDITVRTGLGPDAILNNAFAQSAFHPKDGDHGLGSVHLVASGQNNGDIWMAFAGGKPNIGFDVHIYVATPA